MCEQKTKKIQFRNNLLQFTNVPACAELCSDILSYVLLHYYMHMFSRETAVEMTPEMPAADQCFGTKTARVFNAHVFVWNTL